MELLRQNWIWVLLALSLLGMGWIVVSDREKAAEVQQTEAKKIVEAKAAVAAAAENARLEQKRLDNLAAEKSAAKKALQKEIKKMDDLDKRWADAVTVAYSTARISLPGPMAKLLELKREAEAEVLSDCFARANAHRVKGMTLFNNSMEVFMIDKTDLVKFSTQPLIEESAKEFQSYKFGRKVCEDNS